MKENFFNIEHARKNGSILEFENKLIRNTEQEKRTGRKKGWMELAELYYIQMERLRWYPYPEEFNETTSEETSPPIIKPVTRNTVLEELYRWGIQSKGTGNHRILYTIHDYHKIVLMHYFDKQYNGDIKRKDIKSAEEAYFEYCGENPPKYPIKKE